MTTATASVSVFWSRRKPHTLGHGVVLLSSSSSSSSSSQAQKHPPLEAISMCRCSSSSSSQPKPKPTHQKKNENNNKNDNKNEEEEEERDLSPGVRLALALLLFYKTQISPFLPRSCRYVPTCSEYSMEAYRKYGFLKGSILTASRICRCNPFGGYGFDPPRWLGETIEEPPSDM